MSVCSTVLRYVSVERGEMRHARVGGRRSIRLRAEWIDEWFGRHTRVEHTGAAKGRSMESGTA